MADDIYKFGTFRSTYKRTSLFLCAGLSYPHPETNKRRLFALLIVTITMGPHIVYVLTDIYNFLMAGDILNFTRHTSIIGPYFGGMVKILAACYTAREGNELITELDRDYASYNNMPILYKNIARRWIKNSIKYCQDVWIIVVFMGIITYPFVNMCLNLKSLFYNDDPRRYMFHEINLLFVKAQYESPIFELYYMYSIYAAVWYFLFYVGYDSLFAVLVDHACLKIIIYCQRFEEAVKQRNEQVRLKKMVEVIKEQLRLFQFMENIQLNYNIYLGLMLFGTLIQIGTCLYHVSENPQLSISFIAIAIASICCLYIPCTYSSKLKHMGLESATKFYSSGWEDVNCSKTRKIILFMIARAQIPLEILGFNLILYDMELFVSILQSAYSIYTLLCN